MIYIKEIKINTFGKFKDFHIKLEKFNLLCGLNNSEFNEFFSVLNMLSYMMKVSYARSSWEYNNPNIHPHGFTFSVLMSNGLYWVGQYNKEKNKLVKEQVIDTSNNNKVLLKVELNTYETLYTSKPNDIPFYYYGSIMSVLKDKYLHVKVLNSLVNFFVDEEYYTEKYYGKYFDIEMIEDNLDKLVKRSEKQQVIISTNRPTIMNYLEDDIATAGMIYFYKDHEVVKQIKFFDIPSMREKLTVMGSGAAYEDTALRLLINEIKKL